MKAHQFPVKLRHGLIFIKAPRLTAALSLVVPIGGITVWPFVLTSYDLTETGVRHEAIHGRQWVELGFAGLAAWLVALPFLSPAWLLALPVAWWGPFLALYTACYLRGLAKGLDRSDAYEANCFEREAHAGQRFVDYLDVRPAFNWVRYL